MTPSWLRETNELPRQTVVFHDQLVVCAISSKSRPAWYLTTPSKLPYHAAPNTIAGVPWRIASHPTVPETDATNCAFLLSACVFVFEGTNSTPGILDSDERTSDPAHMLPVEDFLSPKFSNPQASLLQDPQSKVLDRDISTKC